ncbi:MAG: alpha/beta fold hydrolase [Saprospiraceae bacterium]|nr:alpha/beta fold hydrolase [Saprospiraceae bacterium]
MRVTGVVLLLCIIFRAAAQPANLSGIDTIGEVLRLDVYDRADGYYVYLPKAPLQDSLDLVVFLHGYGALNPMIFGKWIEHLVSDQQHCVVYPRYQQSLFKPSPFEFVPNTVEALHHFLQQTAASVPVDIRNMYLIGHSYGGVIAANLAARYEEYNLPHPRAVFVCQPGTGPFSGGVLESYAEIGDEVQLVIMTGSNDQTVGKDLGFRMFKEATNTPRRMLIRQFPDRHADEEIDASHYEPYSVDARYDNGISNFTSGKALRVSRLDQVDVHGYWKIFDRLVEACKADRSLHTQSIEQLSELGRWPDGTPVRALEILLPED